MGKRGGRSVDEVPVRLNVALLTSHVFDSHGRIVWQHLIFPTPWTSPLVGNIDRVGKLFFSDGLIMLAKRPV